MSENLKDVLTNGGFTLEPTFEPILAPSDIVKKLDNYVIGQEKAKKALATTICYHALICTHNKQPAHKIEFELKKSNLVLIGSSGSGKTFLVETLGRILNRKVLIVDISSFTSSGYVGRDTESILKEAMELCNNNEEEFGRMIIFLDEIDKIAAGSDSSGVNSTKVQSQLLKLIEGQDERMMTDHLDRVKEGGSFISTRNILWIFGGAFSMLLEEKRSQVGVNKKSMGFADYSNESTDESIKIEQEDLVKYGLSRELVGRMGQIELLSDLTREDFYNIMTKPVDSLVKQYAHMGKLASVNLSLTESEIWDIVDKAMKLKVGARALKSVCEEHLRARMYF
jgi:ATP-dependent Clp protease ATP-binding subunit ClpX